MVRRNTGDVIIPSQYSRIRNLYSRELELVPTSLEWMDGTNHLLTEWLILTWVSKGSGLLLSHEHQYLHQESGQCHQESPSHCQVWVIWLRRAAQRPEMSLQQPLPLEDHLKKGVMQQSNVPNKCSFNVQCGMGVLHLWLCRTVERVEKRYVRCLRISTTTTRNNDMKHDGSFSRMTRYEDPRINRRNPWMEVLYQVPFVWGNQ